MDSHHIDSALFQFTTRRLRDIIADIGGDGIVSIFNGLDEKLMWYSRGDRMGSSEKSACPVWQRRDRFT